MIQYIKCHCQSCDGYFDIPYSRMSKIQHLIIDFAACPACGAIRNPHLWVGATDQCSECHIPILFFAKIFARAVQPLRSGLCNMHYMQKYRQRITLKTPFDILPAS